MVLTREQILAKNELPRERVSVPEWGGDVYVRVLTGRERDAFEAANIHLGNGRDKRATPNLVNFRARLVVLACCDEAGKRIFNDEDATALGQQSAAALDRVTDVALRLNGMSVAAVEEQEKN